MAGKAWPEWRDWKLELSDHVLDRMVDRGFNETDQRTMLAAAESWRPNMSFPGRAIIETRLGGVRWEVAVGPDKAEVVLVVITAYRVE